ncbi:hypothetical protein HPB47_019546, partial [Ixodes persulcatus]
DLLCSVLRDPGKPDSDSRRLREFFGIVDRCTEFIWQQSLTRLRGSIPKKRPVVTCNVRT